MHPHWQIIFLVNKKEKKNTHKHIHISAVLIKRLHMPKILLEANERESYKDGLIEHLKIHPALRAIWTPAVLVEGNRPTVLIKPIYK